VIPLELDHVGLAVRDLDAARAIFERLGFTLTDQGVHRGPVGPDGAIGRWGTGNHCAMFRAGYFELIGIVDPARHTQHLEAMLAAYAGLHLVALGCADAAAAAGALAGRVAGLAAAPYDLRRPVPCGDDMREARFRILQLDGETWPEGDLFLIEQQTRDVLWQPALMDHANGVTALAGVTLCVPDVAATRKRLAGLVGGEGEPCDGGVSFALDQGRITVTDPPGLAARWPGVVPPVLPWVAAVSLATTRLTALPGELAANRFTATPGHGGSLWIGPDESVGAIVEFIAA
jgi:catechol 2,3-dioxygenase-like lactoylglutathione lyase family enzyme